MYESTKFVHIHTGTDAVETSDADIMLVRAAYLGIIKNRYCGRNKINLQYDRNKIDLHYSQGTGKVLRDNKPAIDVYYIMNGKVSDTTTIDLHYTMNGESI